MRYYLDGPPGARPAGLVAYLAQYAVEAAVSAFDVLPDGGPVGSLPWRTIVGAGAGGLVAGAGGLVGGGSVGLAADLLLGNAQSGGAQLEPALTIVQIDLLNVSPRRARWAEYLICGWARRAGWAVRAAGGKLLYARNAAAPAVAPRPWASLRTAAASGLFDLLFGEERRRRRPARRRQGR